MTTQFRTSRIAALLALVTLPAAAVVAQTPSNFSLGVAVGYGQRSNPLIQSDDVPVYVDIDIAWYAERWFFDNGDLGLTLHDGPVATINTVARINSDRVFFGLTDDGFVRVSAANEPLAQPALLEIPDRDFAVELGVEVLTSGDWGSFSVDVFGDVSGTHRGYTVSTWYQRHFAIGQWAIEAGLGATYADMNFNDYYWGVRSVEASAALPAYLAGGGIDVTGRIGARYVFNRQWTAAIVVEAERLNDETFASPLVDTRTVVGVFAGVGYRFR